MYIQITTRCNMTCAHCCMSATAKGKDMPREVFLAAIKMADEYDMCVTIGGGEPTVHPYFWDFLGLAITHLDYQHTHLITNGKRTEDALRLSRLAQSGVVGVELSQDQYHDRVDASVVKAFDVNRGLGPDFRDLRGIRRAHPILNLGRAAKNGIGTEDDCSCDDLFVTEDGKLWACAHQELQFGTVFEPDIPDDYWQWDSQCSEKNLVEA